MLSDYDTQEPSHTPKQCGSIVVQNIDAPLTVVWSIVRQFGKPQAYKKFVKSCCMISGNGGVGSVRELKLVSGLPAHWSIERLDKLDDKLHVIEFSIIGGDHRLTDYHSTLTLHEIEDEPRNTVVMESYIVHVPDGNTEEDTCSFVDTIIRCNLQSLARIAEKMDVTYSLDEVHWKIKSVWHEAKSKVEWFNITHSLILGRRLISQRKPVLDKDACWQQGLKLGGMANHTSWCGQKM
ncbi:hypothetical protein IFM89_031110 [Coptis chinensis]|uniref:Uncharacterized protein n=1 Tax=Coptis chinensis TaxID=261450 RepID=A0A835IU37_9MAGN|nr:hypothetical protein IFM89_031110 [Coptis chinensis]